MDKRGFIFAPWIVLLTLVMCGIVILNYLNNEEDVGSSLVSPLAVLETRDALEVFEMRETELIESILADMDGDISVGSQEFGDKFRSEFFSGIDEEMRDFLFKDLFWEGQLLGEGNFDKFSFLENVVYSFYVEGAYFSVVRNEVSKEILLNSHTDNDISFPVRAEFKFSEEYLIGKKGNSFFLEESD